MTRPEHLAFCKVCKNQKFEPEQGIICGLTNSIADFDGYCKDFEEDSNLIEERAIKNANSPRLDLADNGLRFANYIIDLLFTIVVSFLIGAVIGIVMALIDPNSLSIFEQENRLIDYIFGFIAGMIYYVAFEGITGRTIGKFITKTKVVDEQGNKPTFSMIVLRSLCRHIPFNALSFLGDPGKGWHDSLSKTRVVKA